jgi:uncharacterized membrane protein YjjP (DUF1212 family)
MPIAHASALRIEQASPSPRFKARFPQGASPCGIVADPCDAFAVNKRTYPVEDMPDARAPYHVRVEFVIELARRLHMYGTTAQRLEGAVTSVARRIDIYCEVWSNPTGMILSFADFQRSNDSSITRVIRLDPGDDHLGKLARADFIAEEVLAGRMHIPDGLEALRAMDSAPSGWAAPLRVLCYGIASASVTGLLPRTGWADLVTAALLGCFIGVLGQLSERRPRLQDAQDAIAAMVATFIATAVAHYVAPLSLQNVIVASLIVLMPGLTLTTAVSELSARQLASGTARFADAMTTLMKLTFGAVAAAELASLLGMTPMANHGETLPLWTPWLSLVAASFAFAVLFKAAKRDVALVMASVWLGYGVMRVTQVLPGLSESNVPIGVFLAGLVVAAMGNLYGLTVNRPSALIRVPGIILLVPGSLGFRSFNLVLEHDVMLGLDTAFAVMAALIALVAGILFGNLLMPTRRNI